MPDDSQSQLIACAALCLAIVIFRRLSGGVKLTLFFGMGATGLLAALGDMANAALAAGRFPDHFASRLVLRRPR